YLEEKTAHEYWLSQLYLPLLYVTTRNEFGYNCTLAYSNWLSVLIPSTQPKKENWWRNNCIRYKVNLYSEAFDRNAPDNEIEKLGRDINEVPEDK
ncbi:MAG: hypothetical protein ACAI35_00470, partial [Candidatus Methylacidiphilales bacterium]